MNINQSRSLATGVTILLIIFGSSIASADGTSHTVNDTAKTTGAANCGGAYNKLKDALKTIARAHCTSEHGSTGSNKLRKEKFKKKNCKLDHDKGKDKIHTVTAELTYECK